MFQTSNQNKNADRINKHVDSKNKRDGISDDLTETLSGVHQTPLTPLPNSWIDTFRNREVYEVWRIGQVDWMMLNKRHYTSYLLVLDANEAIGASGSTTNTGAPWLANWFGLKYGCARVPPPAVPGWSFNGLPLNIAHLQLIYLFETVICHGYLTVYHWKIIFYILIIPFFHITMDNQNSSWSTIPSTV